MVKTKVEVKQEEVVVKKVPDPKPKIEFLKKMLSGKNIPYIQHNLKLNMMI